MKALRDAPGFPAKSRPQHPWAGLTNAAPVSDRSPSADSAVSSVNVPRGRPANRSERRIGVAFRD
jgi:hypothetical protein